MKDHLYCNTTKKDGNQLKKQVSVGSCKTFGRLASLFSVLRALPEQPPAMRAVLPLGALLHSHDEATAGEGTESSRPAYPPVPRQPMAVLCCFEKINNHCHFIAGLLYRDELKWGRLTTRVVCICSWEANLSQQTH